jgi:predicted ester cyclase
VSGDTVVLEITWRGTYQGQLATPKESIPPSDKRIEFRSCVVCEAAGEKAKLQRQYFDMTTMLQQIGADG